MGVLLWIGILASFGGGPAFFLWAFLTDDDVEHYML